MSNKRILRRTMSMIVAISLIFSSFGWVYGANDGSDIQGHWAEQELKNWLKQGFINGFSDGTLRPDQNITRAEFIAFVNRTFGFTDRAKLSFSDIPANSNAWYVKDISTAIAAGYIEGYQDGTMRPNDPISRQEVAAIVARVLELKPDANLDLLNGFLDASSFANWSKAPISAVVEKGYMKGLPDMSFMPFKNITRAEAIVTLDRAMHDKYVVYSNAGTYGPESGIEMIDGNVMISVADVTLRNMVVTGNLLLGVGIGNGDVHLSGVKVQGKTIVQGGGENSIHVINSELFTVIVDKQNGSVRVVATGSTAIADVTLQSGAKLEESKLDGAGFNNVAVKITEQGQIVLSGDFQNVQIDVPNAVVSLASGSVAHLNVNENAQDASIQIENGAKVGALTLNAKSTISGTGKINKANIHAEGTKIEQKPETILLGKGVSAEIGGQKVTESSGGSTVATPTSPSPSTGEENGGGSGPVVVPVSSVTVNPTHLKLTVGETGTITAEASPINATNKNIIWSSSDDRVVTVDVYGSFTAVGLGQAILTATSVSDPSKKATVPVVVVKAYWQASNVGVIELPIIDEDGNQIGSVKEVAKQYRLMADGKTINLKKDMKSIQVSVGDEVMEATDYYFEDLWIPLRMPTGEYIITVKTKDDKIYTAAIDWEQPTTASVSFQAPASASEVFTPASEDDVAIIDFSQVTADKLLNLSTTANPDYYAIELKINGVDLSAENVKQVFRVFHYEDSVIDELEVVGDQSSIFVTTKWQPSFVEMYFVLQDDRIYVLELDVWSLEPKQLDEEDQEFTLTSTAFDDGEAIPFKHSAYFDNVSVPLSWANAPEGTESFVLLMYDLEYKNFIHWYVANIPNHASSIHEGASGIAMPEGSLELDNNDWKNGFYYGPQPPISNDPTIGMNGTHRYQFVLYALNSTLGIDDPAFIPSKIVDPEFPDYPYEEYLLEDIENALGDRVLGKASTLGTYFAEAASPIVGHTITINEDQNTFKMEYDVPDGHSLTIVILPYKPYVRPYKGMSVPDYYDSDPATIVIYNYISGAEIDIGQWGIAFEIYELDQGGKTVKFLNDLLNKTE